MKKSAYKDNRGFTLVELLVGVTILALIIAPLLNTFIVGANTERKSREFGNATNAAQNLSEQIQALDIDAILGDSRLVDSAARFYNVSDPSVLTTAAPPPDSSKYYIRIADYAYGGSTFDALITLDASAAVNSISVVAGNQMDAMLNMAQADAAALEVLKLECSDLMADPDAELTLGALTREVTLKVTRSGSASPYTYNIDAEFAYTGTIICSAEDVSGESYNFEHTEKSSASIASVADSTDGSPVLSAFLFFDGYYKSSYSSHEIFTINNITGEDVNFFLVSTKDKSQMPAGYSSVLWYYNQNVDSGGSPVNNLIFTNIPADKIAYHATSSETLTVNGLAETKVLNRKYDVNIKLFDSGFSGTPLFNLDTTRINY